MKIVLTGASGFLGGWLINDFLGKSYDITVLEALKIDSIIRQTHSIL